MKTFQKFPDNYTKTPQFKVVTTDDLERLVKLKNQLGGKYTFSHYKNGNTITATIHNDKTKDFTTSKSLRTLWNLLIDNQI
jgi:hypothetical protein